jgi:hypothetical protein
MKTLLLKKKIQFRGILEDGGKEQNEQKPEKGNVSDKLKSSLEIQFR